MHLITILKVYLCFYKVSLSLSLNYKVTIYRNNIYEMVCFHNNTQLNCVIFYGAGKTIQWN